MLITTSWDDGHPLDFRIADLLAKYGLAGTFYVPITSTRRTLSPAEIKDLAGSFEIGAHTLHHVRLVGIDPARAKSEIVASKSRLEDILGRPCSIFCFPGGSYTSAHLDMLREAGFTAARTVELLSIQRPRVQHGIAIIPTSIQAYSHDAGCYLKNVAKRGSIRGFTNLLFSGATTLWPSLAQALLERAAEKGGVFHLWGHSWEIEEGREWDKLSQVFRMLAQYKDRAVFTANTGLCSHG